MNGSTGGGGGGSGSSSMAASMNADEQGVSSIGNSIHSGENSNDVFNYSLCKSV